MNGHEMARRLIAIHGRDRYPDAQLNMLKLMEEVGELAAEILDAVTVDDDSGAVWARVRKEYADVGLTLYALGDKLGIDLETEMAAVVENETRRFN